MILDSAPFAVLNIVDPAAQVKGSRAEPAKLSDKTVAQ